MDLPDLSIVRRAAPGPETFVLLPDGGLLVPGDDPEWQALISSADAEAIAKDVDLSALFSVTPLEADAGDAPAAGVELPPSPRRVRRES